MKLENLKTESFGRRHLHLREVDSTNDFLKQRGGDLPNGFVVSADH